MVKTCNCGEMPKIVYYQERFRDFDKLLQLIASGDWIELFSCNVCGQLWRIDTWDKLQTQFAVKINEITTWKTFDSVPLQKELLLKSRGGIGTGKCAWTGCENPNVVGTKLCVDHLYETGARE